MTKVNTPKVDVEKGHVLLSDTNESLLLDDVLARVKTGAEVNPLIHTAEIEWIFNAWDDGYTSVACAIVEGVVIMRAPRLNNLAEKLDKFGIITKVAAKDSWVVVYTGENMDAFDYIIKVTKENDILPSPEVSNLVDGKMKRDISFEWFEEASKFYDPPTIFPSDRVLKPHQKQAVVMMAHSGNVLLTDQVGLGKGGEFISAFLARVEKKLSEGKKEEDCFPCVIVTKLSLKAEIVEEIQKWFKDADVSVLSSRSAVEIEPTDFIVINDAILHDWQSFIIDAKPQALIIDEAHCVNNPKAKKSIAAANIAKSVNRRDGQVILATATPFQNGPYELWGLLKILGVAESYSKYAMEQLRESGEKLSVKIKSRYKGAINVPLTGRMAFEARWCNGHVDHFGHWNNKGASHYSELYQILVSNHMIRRKKSDVISPLPPLVQNNVKMLLEGEDAKLYREQENWFVEHMVDKTKKEAIEEGIDENYALNILNNKLYEAEAVMRVSQLRQTLGVAKAKRAVEWIKEFFDTDNITGGDPKRKKLIVFCHHKSIQKFLVHHKDLQKYGMVNITDENNKPAGIQQAKRDFQKSDKCRLMICSSAALSGHTLTAAYDTLMVELLYGPLSTIQAAGRNWARFSEEFEPHESYFHLLVAMDTIDMATFHSNVIKKSLMSGYVDGEDVDIDLINERELSLSDRQILAKDLLERASKNQLRIV